MEARQQSCFLNLGHTFHPMFIVQQCKMLHCCHVKYYHLFCYYLARKLCGRLLLYNTGGLQPKFWEPILCRSDNSDFQLEHSVISSLVHVKSSSSQLVVSSVGGCSSVSEAQEARFTLSVFTSEISTTGSHVVVQSMEILWQTSRYLFLKSCFHTVYSFLSVTFYSLQLISQSWSLSHENFPLQGFISSQCSDEYI